ncbi:MAG: radical SAM protein [Dehalococcoidia bacterium]|nr:radical SAM protein [Dehalococcoidia bacterium]
MLNVTRLLCDQPTPGDDLRYGETSHTHGRRLSSVHQRPIVIWNITRTCNLHCGHCYASSRNETYPGELSTEKAKEVLRDLADFKVPVVLFSGGEPTMHPDLAELIEYANQLGGLNPLISTNGTLLTKDLVKRLGDAGLNRVGISLDGMEAVHDKFRGSKGSWRLSLDGIRNSLEAGMRVSLRVTVTKQNIDDLPRLFDLAEAEGIPRVCVYHLAYAGRGEKLLKFDLAHDVRRKMVDFVFQRTLDSYASGHKLEVLTVDNHADAAYMQLWVEQNMPEASERVTTLLARNGGNSAGKGMGCIDNLGNVHPDQFWWNQTLGNVKERKFSEIWQDESIELLARLRDRKPLLPGTCSDCRWLNICNGNLRVRAESATRDSFGMDPACYLTDAERVGGLVGAGA